MDSTIPPLELDADLFGPHLQEDYTTVAVSSESAVADPHKMQRYECSSSPPSTTTWNARWAHAVPHDDRYYAQCVAGGVLSSAVRWATVGLDVVKVQMQVNPAKYPGLLSGLRVVWIEEGSAGLFRGLGPTVLTYAFQSGTKYGAYELFKDQFATTLGEERAHRYRGLVYVTAGGLADACAAVLMCPFEMLKVKVQTSPPGSLHTNMGPAFSTLMARRTELRFPFGALVPLLCRQVPGTITNFFVFENTVDAVYKHYLNDWPRDDYSPSVQLGVSLGAGFLAGAVSAVVSHPADSLVSLRSIPRHRGQSLRQIAAQVGLRNLATKGLVPRIWMTGTVIACQWFTYDSFKTAMGMGTSGGEH